MTTRRRVLRSLSTFYYGWRPNDPAGVASADATLTVAEGVVRGMNVGLAAFGFWSFMNPVVLNPFSLTVLTAPA